MKSKELLKKKLTNLASGELATVLVFWMNCRDYGLNDAIANAVDELWTGQPSEG